MSDIFGEITPKSSLSLVRYAKIIGYKECAFFGVADESNDRFACREIWSKSQRDEIAFYLAEAEDELEEFIDYPLSPKWIVNEKHPYKVPLITNKGKLLDVGVELVTDVQLGAGVDLLVDPPTVTVFTTESEVTKLKVYYPDTDLEIIPKNIQKLSAPDRIVITIPKCRLVDYDKLENPTEGWLYSDNTNFQTTVDVKKHDTSYATEATLIWPHTCNTLCASSGCTGSTASACETILDNEIGSMDVLRATYSGGAWSRTVGSTCYSGTPSYVLVNYRAGLPYLSRTAEMIIVRLAHSKMPSEPCGCDVTRRLWMRDRNIPQILTKERLECPFGMSDGAWMAWTFASRIALQRASVL